METLKHAAVQARLGHGQVVAAMAEAGTGKSRLFHEFKLAEQSEWMVVEAFSVSHGKATAYLPVLELLRNYLRLAVEDDLRTRREKVTGRVLALDRALEDTPYLFALGLSEGEDQLGQIDAQIRRRRMHEAIKRILFRESLNQPLILIFEDLHWIDIETQTLLNSIVDSVGTARILLLVNYRPEYQHQWGNRTFYTQLRLDPLGRDNAEEMLRSLLGTAPELNALKRLIIERTEGNPFFMEESVQVLLDEGALVRNGDVKLTRPLGELKIPPTVQAILAARIDRLPPAAKDLLQTLSVIGKDFTFALAREITGKSQEQLEPILAELQLGEFIYEQPAFGGPEYTFKHALTHEVTYNSVLAQQRRVTHERIARAIESLYAEQLDDHFSELAHHFLQSNQTTKALHYTQLAARQDLDRAAYGEAGSMLEAGLKLLEKMPEGVERMRTELALRGIESTLAFVLYGASSPARERTIRRMCELAEKLDEEDELLRSLIVLVQLHFTKGAALLGLEIAKRCLELARTSNHPRLLIDAYWTVAVSSESCGNLSEARSHYEQARRQLERVDSGVLFGDSRGNPRLSPTSRRLSTCSVIWRKPENSPRRRCGAHESTHLFTLGHALTCSGGWMIRYRREPQSGLSYAEETIALAEEHGFAEWLPWGRFHRGWAWSELGQLEEGVAEMEAAIADFARLGGVPRQQYAIAGLARAYARMGRVEQGLTMLDGAIAHAGSSGEKVDLAEMLRLKGEITLMRGPFEEAEAERCFRAALEVARAQEARWWELRISTSLASLLAKQGRRDEARAMLSGIYSSFTEGFDTADLKDAKALLDELNSQVQ